MTNKLDDNDDAIVLVVDRFSTASLAAHRRAADEGRIDEWESFS